jgi:alkylation response protein AidB-like acyl-CoA dehydrogenase
VVLDLTDDQALLRDTAVRFLAARVPMREVRRLADAPGTEDPALRRDAGDLGWFAFFVPERFGGGSVSGSPVRDAVIVAEARGGFAPPGPFVATNVVAFALARDGTAAQQAQYLPALASGNLTAAWAITDGSGSPEPGAVRVGTRDDGFVLDGAAELVHEGVDAGLYLVAAEHHDGAEGASQFLVPAGTTGVTVVPRAGLDLTQRFAAVRFDHVAVARDALVGTERSAARSIERQNDIGAVLTIADSVGAMRHLMEMTVGYAKQRIAFGRPIGSFQALKHLLADASLSTEMSTAALYATRDAVADDRPSASEIVSITKAYAGDAGVDVAQTCLQAHGGIGFTWEHDLHFFLRRLQTNRVLYGDPSWHHERICRIHRLGTTAHHAR